MSFRMWFAQDAQAGLHALPSETRRRFDAELGRIAEDPYHPDSLAITGRDFRHVLLAGCVAAYHVDEDARLVSVIRIEGPAPV
ncbi:hypothetical protein [Embleya sp. NPDC050493]|uniref:hypothetical protein n=1 Tax=Embleya sp. NPDC050493 TaxID=3363989 RepID=UPI0037922734